MRLLVNPVPRLLVDEAAGGEIWSSKKIYFFNWLDYEGTT